MATRMQKVREVSERQPLRQDPGVERRRGRMRRRSTDDGGQHRSRGNGNELRLARGLGWFSVAFGAAEVLSPRAVGRIAGFQGDNTGLIRLYGLREIASGLGIFAQKRPAAAVWSRVAGDALDLASLGAAFGSPRADKRRVALATASVLGVTALDIICARQLTASKAAEEAGVHVTQTIAINRAPEEVYRFWLNFENLPSFMSHLESVEMTGEGRSRWVANAPAGTSVEWQAEVTEDVPNERIGWCSVAGSEVENSGFVAFEPLPGGRGTLVRVEIDYDPPGGALGARVAKLFGEAPDQQIQDDLRRLKQLLETGEIAVSDATLFGRGYLEQRPAQPPSPEELQNMKQPLKRTAARGF